MADQLDNRPVFTVVLGCAGAGKTAWKRENWDRLPTRYFDHNSFAGGVGDWDTESAKARARQVVGQEIDKAMEAGLDFGVESTCPGGPGRELVERVKRAGYRVEAVYIGTESPEINVEGVAHRVASRTGHRADVEKLPEDHAVSLSDPPLLVTHVPLVVVPDGCVNVHGHHHDFRPLETGPWINVSVEQTGYRPLDVRTQVLPLARALAAGRAPEGATTIDRIRRAGFAN